MNKTLGLLAVFCLINTAALAAEWSKTFSVSGVPELRVEADDAAINLRVWERSEIEARVIASGWEIRRDELQVIARQTDNRIDLEVRIPHTWRSFRGRSVRVDLRVPRDLRSDIHTGDGNISVESLHGETRLSTGDGNIDAAAVEGALSASTGDGNIRVRGRFDRLDLRTGDGRADADIGRGSHMASDWTIRSGDGSVNVRFPANFSADLNVESGGGHIQFDVPAMAREGRNEHRLRGRLHEGGHVLDIRTGDGSIHLE